LSYAVLFPGQGSQHVGMGGDLFDARPDLLGDRADQILGWSLRDMCLDGPEDELTRTEHAQPALFALSYALWAEVAGLVPAPAAAAGHSLGEYTALVAAGILDYETALAVVAERGRAMQAAADVEPSGMAALLGADLETAEAIVAARAAQGGRLSIANLNAPGQVVVAGGVADLEWLEEHGRDLGVRRAVRLKVAGGFHSPFMEPAAGRVAEAVDGIDVGAPAFPVFANVTGRPILTDDLARLLAIQVVSPVLFAETLANMEEAGITTFVHVGPGDVTAGMAKRTVEGADVVTINERSGIEQAAALLRKRTAPGRAP
jgi:[acyl-carrier-protein] S-malonyltransferase